MDAWGDSLGWADLFLAALPIACMGMCIFGALRHIWFTGTLYSPLYKLWVSVLFLWVLFAFSLIFYFGFWSCQERLEAAMQSLLLRGGKSLAPFEVTYALSTLPTSGPYAFWPERLWFTDRRIVDYTDPQWREWRVQLPLVLIGGAITVCLSRLIQHIFKNSVPITVQYWEDLKRRGKLDSDYRSVTEMGLYARLLYYIILGSGVVLYLHGVGGFLRLAVVIAVNFLIGRVFGPSRLNPIMTWIWNCTILFSSDYYQGFRFAPLLGDKFLWLDTHMGILRWGVHFNIAFTRLISFNMDYYWMLNNSPINRRKSNDLFVRQESHASNENYGWMAYLAYFLYIPLYLAGPVLSFNAWISQIRYPQQTYSLRKILLLLLRTLAETLALSLTLGYYYYYYIDEHVEIWSKLAPWEITMTACFTLVYMYMKFLCIWRTFRCWSLLDGVDCIDNMSACVYNVASFADFWRQWHSSLHNWIVRYLYLPLGGSKNQQWTMWIIFLFIGLWHDLWWRWVAWAFFNGMFFSVELMVRVYFAKPRWEGLRGRWYYPVIAGAGSAFSIFCLFVANLAIMHGFANTKLFLEVLALQDDSWKTLLMIAVTCWAWAMLHSHFDRVQHKPLTRHAD